MWANTNEEPIPASFTKYLAKKVLALDVVRQFSRRTPKNA